MPDCDAQIVSAFKLIAGPSRPEHAFGVPARYPTLPHATPRYPTLRDASDAQRQAAKMIPRDLVHLNGHVACAPRLAGEAE